MSNSLSSRCVNSSLENPAAAPLLAPFPFSSLPPFIFAGCSLQLYGYLNVTSDEYAVVKLTEKSALVLKGEERIPFFLPAALYFRRMLLLLCQLHNDALFPL